MPDGFFMLVGTAFAILGILSADDYNKTRSNGMVLLGCVTIIVGAL